MRFLVVILFASFLFVAESAYPETRILRIGRDKWRCPKDGNDIYTFREVTFKDGDDLFSKIGATNLQKSLFYQDFLPEFFYLDNFFGEFEHSFKFNEKVYDEYLMEKIKIRDAKKAFEYAKKDEEKPRREKSYLAATNLANLYLCGIGTEKDEKKALEIIKKNNIYPPLQAYLYYKGIGCERDIKKCDKILEDEFYNAFWRNFYAGYLVPRDFDFVIYILKEINDVWAAQTLADIYSGKYLPEDANLKEASYWGKITQERLPEFYKSWEDLCRRYTKDVDLPVKAFLFGTKKMRIRNRFFSGDFSYINPFYDEEKAKYCFDKYINLRKKYYKELEPRYKKSYKNEADYVYKKLKRAYDFYYPEILQEESKYIDKTTPQIVEECDMIGICLGQRLVLKTKALSLNILTP